MFLLECECQARLERVKMPSMSAIDVMTPHGLARVHMHPADEPEGAVILGHGAGGGVAAPDLVAATKAALSTGWTVALVEQPYRVAGRRSPPRAPVLDAAWIAVLAQLAADKLAGLPLVTGGRSLGGRVACRTAEETKAVGVICLAFPLDPPRRGNKPPQSRLDELENVNVPVLVVQGESDPYGTPPPSASREVVTVPGDHGLKKDPDAVSAAVSSWLTAVPAARTR
jgi:predicted alpha/beta-hydrolase family hydrolase